MGKKICIDGANGTGPYETFTILESVGQVAGDYLFWNTDNCSIGGGFNRFTCYKNGDFTYPPSLECKESFLTNINEQTIIRTIEIFPNPVDDLLNVHLMNSTIEEVTILNIDGREILNEKVNGNWARLNVSQLKSGLYLVKIKMNDQAIVNRFFKT